MALSSESAALVNLAISAFFVSVMGSFMKLASTDVPSTQLVFYRACFQGCIVIVGMTVMREEDTLEHRDEDETSGSSNSSAEPRLLIFVPLGNRKQRCIVISRGIAGGFAFVCYFYAIKVLPLGDAVTLFSLYPIVTVFLARFFLGEKIRCLNVLAAFASMIGAIMIAGPSFIMTRNVDHLPVHPLGCIAALVGSVAGAVVMVLNRQAGNLNVHTFQLIFSWTIFSVAFSLLFGQTIGGEIEEKWHAPQSREIRFYIFGMVIFGSFGHFLMNYAARMAPAGLGAIVRSSDIMWSYMWEIIIFHQVPEWATIFGGLMVLTSLMMIAVAKVNDERCINRRDRTESLPILHVDELRRDNQTNPVSRTGIQHQQCEYLSIKA